MRATLFETRSGHRLMGLVPNRPKYPIVMERVRDGKMVLCTEDVIKKISAAHPEMDPTDETIRMEG
jgi:hypothetical protein